MATEYNFNTVWGGNILLQCFDTWQKKEKTTYNLPIVTCWTIWLIRNKFIFESNTPSVQGALAQIRGLKVGTSALSKFIPERIRKLRDIVFPNIGWFYGVSQNNGTMSGTGGIIKIGENTSYRWTFNCGLVRIRGLRSLVPGPP